MEAQTLTTTGAIREELNIEWKIKDFLEQEAKLFVSPTFSFAGHVWCLRMYPNGRESKRNIRYISLYLRRQSFGPAIKVNYTLGLKTVDGIIDPESYCSDTFDKAEVSYGLLKFIRISEFFYRESELLIEKALVVVCALKRRISDEEGANEKLLNDLKGMMINGDHSDVTIKVKGEEFKLHRNILSSRNLFFNAMFKIEMREKVTGIVSIDDCEPHIFRSFIHFLYTGKVDKLSPENVCDLYLMADKYQEDKLKEECLHCMINSISVDTFCDFMALAIKRNEKTLLQAGSEFFCIKTKKIIQNQKWETFLSEYPAQANELHVKSLENLDRDESTLNFHSTQTTNLFLPYFSQVKNDF